MRAESSHDPSLALIGAQVASLLAMVAVGLPAAWMLLVADSGRGRLFAATTLLMGVLPWVAVMARRRRTRYWVASGLALGTLWLGAAALVLMLIPDGQAGPQARVRHVFVTEGESFPRFSPANLLPEGDQLLFGFTLMPMIDRLFTLTQAGELKAVTAPIYRELESDAEFRALGSAMGEPYAELLGWSWPTRQTEPESRAVGSGDGRRPGSRGHVYVYDPGSREASPRARPVLVFFHGSGGNFKAYLWILSKLADRTGFILAAPSNGLGNWTPEDSAQALADALAAAGRTAAIDRGRVHIMGLSNGGLAVSQLAASPDTPLASITLLSPVFDVPEIRSTAFANQNRGRRVLVVTGDRDDRIPLDYVEENVARMKRGGAEVTLQTIGQADHFLMFSHRERLLTVLQEWFDRER